MPFKKTFLLLLAIASFYLLPAQPGFKLFFEKVYLHLDRSYYAPGEDIWFKAYLANAQSNRSTTTSNNLYVELMDPDNKIFAREVVRIDNGVGLGDFKLDDSIPPGRYIIHAYTNWMRNFGTHFVFEKEVWIAGPGPSGNTASPAGDARNDRPAPRKAPARNAYSIQFLPEGGLLIQGVPTMVAFRAEDAGGKGVEASGSIYGPAGDTVASFTTNWLGMGRFAFTPQPGLQYKAIVRYKNNTPVAAGFPEAYADGFVMNIDNTDTSALLVSVSTNAATLSRHSGELTLAGRHGGLLYYKEKITLAGGKALVKVPRDNFPGGIAAITLYDEKLRAQCERLVYVDKKEALHVTIDADKPAYTARQKTILHISVTDAQQQPVKAAFSLSAVDGNFVKADADNITSYLMLRSELTGPVEEAARYFDPANNRRWQQLDLLLSTQGWRSFIWRLMADTSIHISYLPEPGITISGRVRELFANKPLPDMNITLMASGARGNKLYTARTDSAGRYYLDGLQLYGNQPIKINSKNNKGKKGGWILMDTLFNNPLTINDNARPADKTAISETFATEALKRHTLSKKDPVLLQEVVVTNRNKATTLRDGNAYSSFGYPEFNRTISKEDFKFETLANYLVHKAGAVADVETNGVTFIANGKNVRPRFIVDKREDVFERIDYYQVHMEQVVSVSVRHLVGHPSFTRTDTGGRMDLGGGIQDVFIVYLVLKPGAYNQDMAMIVTDVTGYYNARAFYAPVYVSPNEDRKPDMRTTVHWEPMLVTDENGKATVSFYNADPKTSVRVSLEGLSDKGVPLTGIMKYEVR